MLDETGQMQVGAASPDQCKRVGGSFWGDAAQSDRTGSRDAFAPDQSLIEAVGARGDRGECAQVRLIGKSRKKDDRLDAQTLARLARIDPELLYPVKHRSASPGAFHAGKTPVKREGVPPGYPSRNFVNMVRPERFELPTFWFVARRSIQLS